jgi:hypothetical protein
MLPADEVKIDPVNVNNIRAGEEHQYKEAVGGICMFQDSQGTHKAYLVKTIELTFMGRNKKGEWGLALGAQAQLSLIDLVGMSFFPLYSVVAP